jgi:YesN/AraC family two-component response regulator
MVVCLINLAAGGSHELEGSGPGIMTNAAAKSELIRIANTAQLFVQEKFRMRFTAAVGGVVGSIEGIPHSYSQALEALEHKFVMGGGKVILFDDLESSSHSYFYPIEIEQQLINSIKIGDYTGSQSICNKIFERNLSSSTLSVQMVKCLMFDMISTVVKTLDELGLSAEGRFLEQVNPVGRLVNCEDVFEMKEQMSDILRQVCSYVERKKKSHNTGLKDIVEAYVRNNYADYNLSISLIAGELNMNASYLSRFYKEQAGESLVDYINKTRIGAAKSLMANPDLTLSDIAGSVGYSSNIALIRSFKRYMGITPGKYRGAEQ